MTYSEDLFRLLKFRIEALENKVEELEAKLEIIQNHETY
jgi:hypothetical protein